MAENRGAFHAGAGAEFSLSPTPTLYAKAEYVYTAYKGASYDDGDLALGVEATRH